MSSLAVLERDRWLWLRARRAHRFLTAVGGYAGPGRVVVTLADVYRYPTGRGPRAGLRLVAFARDVVGLALLEPAGLEVILVRKEK